MRVYTVCVRFVVLLVLAAVSAWAGDGVADDFEALELGKGWEVRGAVSLDPEQGRAKSHAALKVGPGGRAVLPLREVAGAGVVELWVYDDRTVPGAPDARRGGPQWGLIDADGRVLTVGCIYAPYLKGAQQVAAASYNPGKKESPLQGVQYLATNRVPGWSRWTFRMDATAGLSIELNGKTLSRFAWDRTGFAGFTGVVILGDSRDDADAQTLWVDDVTATLAGAMTAKPTPPVPPKPVVPETDPALTGEPVALLPAVAGVHPRLFFGPEDVAALRAKVQDPALAADYAAMLSYLGACKPPAADKVQFLTDATDGQRQGLWRMPTLALHYTLTGDATSLARARGFMELLLTLPTWETGAENNSGMSAANVNIGAAICYDLLYHDLEPAFRERFRQRLVQQARAQYYGGHLNLNKATGYWQGDPANNHRWHRDAGMALAILAAWEGKPEEAWILQQTAAELAFVATWLPADGTSHESPTYLTFGMPHLALAMQAADRCLGTGYLDQPFSKSVAAYKLQTLTPGLTDGFQFGDSSGVGSYNGFVWLYTGRHRQADVQAGFQQLQAVQPKAYDVSVAWLNVLWKDPTVSGGEVAKVPRYSYFPDLGLAFMRDSWAADGAAAMFKCGPFGGDRLNTYRNENDFRYINVAHDDPDANSFTLFRAGDFLAETDRYAKHKQSANHNTILVNGAGQQAKGRPEGAGWSQPATGKTDMKQMASVTGYLQADGVTIIEGEAGGSYAPLQRFRRTFVWVEGQYVLVLDDIQAPADAEPVTVTWLLQAPAMSAVTAAPVFLEKPAELSTLEPAAGHTNFQYAYRYVLEAGEQRCPVIVCADQRQQGLIADSSADHRGKVLGWKQLQLTSTARQVRVVSVYDLWDRGDIALRMSRDSTTAATIRISGKELADTWAWQLATAADRASTLTGRVTFDAATATPPAP